MLHELLEHSNNGTGDICMLRKHDGSDSTKIRRQVLGRITRIPSNISATEGFGLETLILESIMSDPQVSCSLNLF